MSPLTSPALERVRAAYARNAAADRPEIWITLRPQAEAEADARALDARLAAGERFPLAGRVFAVKGNIDAAGIPTTAGCPEYAYTPAADAPAVARLRAAGAVLLGATNLDQFATGLVGTRSPYGAVRNALDPAYVSGGSSSGSAVAVALGIADLALGTDTAGSGRVPAAFNGIIGLKPSPGSVPTTGVVPACASLDCVTVFARTLDEAERAYGLIADRGAVPATGWTGPPRIAVPADPAQLGALAPGWAEAYQSTINQFIDNGAELIPIDLSPFLDAARMLYEGAFVAERYTAVGDFLDAHPADASPSSRTDSSRGDPMGIDPTVRRIITCARDIPAHRLFADQARLAELRAAALAELASADALLLPTAPNHPTLTEVAADPVGTNADLGRFTNSTNLFGLCALAFPGAELPETADVTTTPSPRLGVMLIARPGADAHLAAMARPVLEPRVHLAVVGAHLTGQPLNPELLALGAHFVRPIRTSADYRLHALPTTPAKPGLVRVTENGARIEAEVWSLPAAGLGRLLSTLPSPMTLGRVDLSDGTSVPGFLCEPAALPQALDITQHGGWRAYRAAAECRMRSVKIEPDDLSSPDLASSDIADFLNDHVQQMRSLSPPESKHALDLDSLRAPEVTFWTARDDDGHLVGCGALKRLDPSHAELKSMRTDPSRQRGGIASQLLRHIIAEAEQTGCTRLSLETGSADFFLPARTLYEKFGFTACAPFADYRPDPNSTFMTLSLPARA